MVEYLHTQFKNIIQTRKVAHRDWLWNGIEKLNLIPKCCPQMIIWASLWHHYDSIQKTESAHGYRGLTATYCTIADRFPSCKRASCGRAWIERLVRLPTALSKSKCLQQEDDQRSLATQRWREKCMASCRRRVTRSNLSRSVARSRQIATHFFSKRIILQRIVGKVDESSLLCSIAR